MEKFKCIKSFIAESRPAAPYFCLNLNEINKCTESLVSMFPGEVAYAVKCNPHRLVLEEIIRSGGQAWDVASIEEIRLVNSLSRILPSYFMNPIKSASEIFEAYSSFNIKEFAVDQEDEVRKFMRLEIPASDITLSVRLAVSGHGALASMAGKFGVEFSEAVRLIKFIHAHGFKCGITFHVGSQCLAPEEYSKSIAQAIAVAESSQVPISVLDVGGGFPAKYEGHESGFDLYNDAIKISLSGSVLEKSHLRCEPGRAIAASSVMVLTKVLAVRSNGLVHINDGIYGGLSEINFLDCTFPVAVWSDAGERLTGGGRSWKIAGPTCDSSDIFKKEYLLPASIKVGDYIGFGMLGAYSPSLATRFNGYGTQDWVQVSHY